MAVLFCLAAFISLGLFWGMRHGSVRGGFVALWMIVCVALLTLPFLDSHYKELAAFLGFSYARDMLNMSVILFLMVYVFYLTAKLQRVLDAVELLQSRAAIAEHLIGLNEKARNSIITS